MALSVFTDFDGTITEQDTLVHLLDRYAGPEWLEIERRVEDGELSEELGLREEIALLTVPWEEALASVLERVPVDPGFAGFAALCEARGWPLTILSGGLEPLIRAVLAREGLERVPLRANGLGFEPDGRWRVIPAATPRINALCNHCKSHWLADAAGNGTRTLYIGDGTTDRCPAGRADLVFAKGALAEWCEARGLAHRRFARFDEIGAWLGGSEGSAWLAGAGR